jgi:hypothetical protein
MLVSIKMLKQFQQYQQREQSRLLVIVLSQNSIARVTTHFLSTAQTDLLKIHINLSSIQGLK